MLAVQWLTVLGAAAAPPAVPPLPLPLPGVAVLPATDGQATLVVDMGGFTQPVGQGSFTVTVGGVPQPATVVPVVSDRLSTGIVVDASAAGGQYIQGWLSGAARFVLEAPAASRTTVVADTSPPRVLAPLQQGPVDLIRTLSGVQAQGGRRTSDALTLAADQLGTAPAAPRVIVLYTTSPDAGGEAAAHLATRLAKAHALLVVVGTAADTRYWSTVAEGTGGFLAPAGAPTVAPALDQVATMLRSRYVVTFPAPSGHPARASVRVSFQGIVMAGDVTVPAAQDDGGLVARIQTLWARAALWVVLALVSLVLLLAVTLVVALRPS